MFRKMKGIPRLLAITLVCLFICKAASVKHICQETKCKLNVCFALAGSLAPSTYKTQKGIVREVVNRISSGKNKIAVAAVQYAITTLPISPLTTDKKAFLSALDASVQSKGKMSFTVGGLNYCFDQLNDELGKPRKESGIILLGDGKSDIGSDPGERSAEFSEKGGVVFAVGVGKSQDMFALTDIAGGERKRVLSLDADTTADDVSFRLAKLLCACRRKGMMSQMDETVPTMESNEVE